MTKIEEIGNGVTIKGILSNDSVFIIDAKWNGSNVKEITSKNSRGNSVVNYL